MDVTDITEEHRQAILAMPIKDFFSPLRIQCKVFPVRETRRLYKMLQERSQEPRYFVIFGVEKMETIGDICMMSAKTIRSMPGISTRLERLLSRLLAAEGVSLSCVVAKNKPGKGSY